MTGKLDLSSLRDVQNRPTSSRSDKTSRVLEQQNQVPLVRRRWLETKTSIKRISLGVDGMR